ncbi:MAG: DUF1573 domain-containing protein [Thermodesulfobacteriota bacterium]
MSRPRRLVWLLTALAALVWAAPALAAAPKGPKIVFDQTEIVYPNAKEGQTLAAQFTFTNQGAQNVIVDSVTPSCGCQVAKFDKVVAPGQKGVINLELDTSGITGAFRKTAVVASNDPTNPFVTLVMIGETSSRVKVEKGRRLDLAGCLGGNVSVSTDLSEPEGRPLIIAGVENPMSEYLDAALSRQADGRRYTLTITSKAKEPMEYAGPIYLVVPGASKVSLYVVADIKGPFSVSPQEVYFGGISQGLKGDVQRSIQVQKTCVDKLVIEKLIYDADKFKVEERWTEPEGRLLLVVSPRQDKLPKGPFEDKIGIQSQGKIFYVRLKGIVN